MKYLSTLIICLSISVIANTQEENAIAKALESSPSMEVNSDLLKFNKETKHGFSSYLNTAQGDAEKKWKEFLENKYQAEVKKTKGGFISEDVKMPEISAVQMDVTALFSEDEEGCKMNVFYELSGHYINPDDHAKESLAIMTSLKEYQKQLYVMVYQSTLQTQRKGQEKSQKALDKLVKEGEKLDKDVAKEEGDINKSEQTIIESEQKIAELQSKMEELRGEIEQSKSTIVELKKAKEKKLGEVDVQKAVVTEKSAQIDRIKTAADKVGIN